TSRRSPRYRTDARRRFLRDAAQSDIAPAVLAPGAGRARGRIAGAHHAADHVFRSWRAPLGDGARPAAARDCAPTVAQGLRLCGLAGNRFSRRAFLFFVAHWRACWARFFWRTVWGGAGHPGARSAPPPPPWHRRAVGRSGPPAARDA